ncbi:MAG TPA: NAD(P)-dependent oxidoreductase [Microbacteriaceae bacterium]
MTTKLRVGIACRPDLRDHYLSPVDLARLGAIAELSIADFEVPGDTWGQIAVVPEFEERLAEFASDKDVLLVFHGAPRVTERVFAAAPSLRIVGDIEGDRFAGRIDVAAAHAAGVLVVDTTHASSWPVAEWALALMLVGLRQNARFREIIAGQDMSQKDYRTRPPGRELTGKTVGLISFGHIGWRLREFLVPFECPIIAYDPYAPREFADAQNIDFASLDTVMGCEVVVCLAPATPHTIGMIGEAELALLREDAVFINVSRGTVVDVDALIARAERGDAWFGLDAHNPEPIAVDSPLRGMSNVFLSPHIAGVTAEAQPRFFALMVDELERFASGLEPRAQITDRVIAGRGGA